MKSETIIILLLLLSASTIAQKQDTVKLNEVIIGDSLIHQSNILMLSHKSKLIKSTGELMQEIPGITFSKRSVFSVEPVINAFKYEQINTTINGGLKASCSCPNRMDPITTRISPNEIIRIEFERGPYDVRYGASMGGFVNIITAEKPNYDKFTVLGDIASEYNFNGNGSISSVNIKAGNKIFDTKINTSYRKFGDYKSGDGTEIASSYETYGINTSLGLNISKKQRIVLNYMYSKANDVMHAGLPMDAKYDESNILSLDYNFYDIGEMINAFKLKLFYSDENHLMTNEYRPNSAVTLANTPVTSNDLGGRMELTLTPFEKSIMHIGADYKQTAKDGSKDVVIYKNICTNPPVIFNPPVEKSFEVWQNSYHQDIGVFTDIKYYLSEKLSSKVGFRMDYIKSDIKDPEKDFMALYNDNITPNDITNFGYYLKVNYKLPKNYNVELAAGTGNRAPSLLEKYINHFTVGLDAYEYVGNPHLKSEINHQADLILSKKHKQFYAYADVFVSNIENYITAIEDTTILRKSTPCKEPKYAKRFVNVDEVMQYGFNVGAKINFFKYFNANIDLTYTYAENVSLNEPLPEIAPFTSLISLNFEKNKLAASLTNEYQSKQTRVSSLAGEKESQAFTVFNIKASYLLFKKLNLGLAIDNIFNTNYYRHLSRPYKNMDTTSLFYEAGRSFRIFIKYNF